jgi:outer membrane autotransporter protein
MVLNMLIMFRERELSLSQGNQMKKLTKAVNTIGLTAISFGMWLFVGVVYFSSIAFGAPNNWNGSVGTNWGTAANWNALPSNGADLNFGALSATNTNSNNNSLTSINSITFQGAQAFTLHGNALTLGTGNVNGIAITNNSSQTQNINFGGTGLTLASGNQIQRWIAANGDLTFGSKVDLNGTSLGLHGPGTITLNSAISGNGNSNQTASLVIGDFAGVGHVVLKGNNSGLNAPGGGNPYSVSLLAGNLTIGNVNALGSGALLIDHSGNNGAQDTLGTTGNFSIANSIDTRNSFVFAPIGTFQIKGNLTLDTSKGITAFNLSNSASQATNYVNLNGVVQETAASSLTFNGGGRFALSGASSNTYSGLTTVTGGTQLELRKTGGALAIQSDLTVNAGSKVQLEGNGEINSTSTVTLNGTLDFNGNTQTVKTLTDNGTSSGFLRFGNGGQLIINGSTNSFFSGVIQDDGAEAGVLELVKTGSGTLTLTGNNTFTGTTQLQSGALKIGSNNALGIGNVSVIGGTLSTNGIQQNINVGGIYSQTAGTLTLTLLTAANNSNEKLVVTGAGSSTLGGNMVINGNNLTVTANLTYDLASFTNGYLGTFNTSITNLNTAGFLTMFNYTTNDVTLTFLQSLGILNGLTPNQHSVGTYIDSFAPNAPAIGGNFQTLVNNIYLLSGNTAALGSALDQISPQSLQIWRHIAFDNSTFYSQMITNHLAGLRDGVTGFDGSQMTYTDSTLDPLLAQIKSRMLVWNPVSTPGLVRDVADPVLAGVRMSDAKDLKAYTKSGPENRWSTFIAGNVILANLSHDQDLAHQSYTTGSVTAGADYHLDPNWTVGGMLAYGHTDATLDHIGSSTTVDSYSPGVYASYVDQSGWYGNALFSYGYNSYTEDRNIQIGALNGTNHGAPEGSQYVGNLTGGYEFKEGNWKIGPIGSLQYVNLGINSFTEQGPTALNVQAQSVESLRSQLGFETRYAGHVQGWFGSFDLTPHFSATWQHEYIDEAGGITSQFNQLGSGSFTIQTTGTERDSAFIDAGLDAQVEDDITLFADYQTQVGQNHYYAQSVQAGLKIAF